MARARKIHFSSLLLVLDSIDADIYAADLDSYEILYMNRHMGESFGGDFAGQVCYRVFRKEDAPCPHCTNARLLDEEGKPAGVLVWEGRNPVTGRWYKNSDRAIPWEGGRYVRLQIATDITGLKEAEARLQHLATHDPLTLLPHRQLFDDRLKHALELARRGQSRVALLFLDLDGFKAVNDRHGHQAGDELLRGVAERLKSAVRDSDTVARLAGDEFALILEKTQDPGTARAVAVRVLQELRRPFLLPGAELAVTASIGIACFPEQARSPQELLRLADEAMYRAKGSGKDTFVECGG
jgi:diguanylate cyclase (GGDEF)-like protein